MAITFNCAQCGKSYTLDDSLAGKQAKCSCGIEMTVPAPSAAPVPPPIAPAAPASPFAAGQLPPAAPMPGQPMPGQPMLGQPMPGQPMPGQPMPGQPMQGQPMPGQPMPGQPMQGQPMQGQPMQGQPMQGQPMQGQPMQGQPMPGSPYASPGYAPQGGGTADGARVEALFKWYWIHLLWGFLTSCIIVGIIGLIASAVYQFMLIYKLWSLIPRERAETTPGKAIGFLFIPFFNLYWIFVAIHGLAKGLNNELRSVAPGKQVSEGLSLTFCILSIVNIIPYVNLITGTVNIVIMIILMKQFTDAGVALANSRGR